MRVIFRVDSSFEIGTGHVMRCLVLAKILKENNSNVEFICRQHQGHLVNKIRLNGFNVYELDSLEKVPVNNALPYSHMLGTTQNQDANDCIRLLKNKKIDWLIVDHYAIDEEWQIKLNPYYKKLMVIDDLANRNHRCDILLDQTFGRELEDYSGLTPKYCNLLLGSKYALLRTEFFEWRDYSLKRRINPKFNQLLVNMGGFDASNVTGRIVRELQTCTLPNEITITIVMSAKSPHLKDVLIAVDELPYKSEILLDVDNMAEIMANADIAIGASGSSSLERCCMGLPSIQIVIASNQIFLAQMLATYNIVKLLTEFNEIGCFLEDTAKWMKRASDLASNICDGKGGYKVFNTLSDYKIVLDKFGEVELCNYINLNNNDKIFVLSMRNHPQIKKWMHNQEDISEKKHIAFIKNLENDVKKRYFLVKYKDNIIGSINFSEIDINNSVIFGIYTNPFIQFKGAGLILESTASHYAFINLGVIKIQLQVLVSNARAINFYNKCGFTVVTKKKTNYKNILYMEKKTMEALK